MTETRTAASPPLTPGASAMSAPQIDLRASRLRRRLLAIGAGAGAALAFAPTYFLPLIVVGYSCLVMLIDHAWEGPRPARTSFLYGWLFGATFHLVGLHWLAFAFLVQAEEFAWMAPFAVVGMAGFLGLFSGAACALAVRFWSTRARRVLVLAGAVAAAEFLRGHVLTGLPWNLPAQALAGLASTAQPVAWVGPYGYSAFVLAVSMLPAAFARFHSPFANLDCRVGGVALGATAAVMVYLGVVVAGSIRIAMLPDPAPTGTQVVVVQPNIPQREKIDPDLYDRNIEIAVSLSGPRPGDEGVSKRFVIWPENAATLIDENPAALAAVGRQLRPGDILVTGAVRRGYDEAGRLRVYNSIIAARGVPDAGPARLAAYYDKHHLAPFGEYLPFPELLKALGLAQLAPFEEGFTPGEGPAVMDLGGEPFAPLICYETIFPGASYPRGARPSWLLTATNDAWFGDTAGPRQHLDQARFRSIETGLPMARAANTGISALIDAKGRYLDRLPLYQRGVIVMDLPGPLPAPIYERLGETPALLLIATAFGLGIPRRARAPGDAVK